ncbi:hypothetical protein TNCV_3272021 [Trichonephila clavipes]|nr:hypothetical protein TNCV_3272021 [Trichonephila clavipes]
MITNFFIPELNNCDVQELWFQQDCATCYTARATIDLLKDTFGDRLISAFRWRKFQVQSNVRRSSDDHLPGATVLAASFTCIAQDKSLVRLPLRLPLNLEEIFAVP